MPQVLKVQSRDQKPFQIRAKGKTSAEIVIYDVIGYDWWTGGGITAASFDKELKALDPAVTELVVRINSPGGDVFDGIAIYNRLKQHKAKKKVYIDGLAASISSVIALAGDEIIMGEGALYMIHLPWTMAMGNRLAFEEVSDRLRDVEEQMLGIYQRATKLDRSELRAMLEKETWMGAEEAKDKGFVSATVEETYAIAASVVDRAKWINKAPKDMVVEIQVLKNDLKNRRAEIEKVLARK